MNEFSLIEHYFKKPVILRSDVVFGIGDDAACVQVLPGHQLVISTDTLVAEVHFLSIWDPCDIAYRAVMVNISDMAAMGAEPCWISLAITMPAADESWLKRFSQGLHEALKPFNIMLIGGDTTRGPLSITMTIHGLVKAGKALRRNGARPGDIIMVSGELGAAALAVTFLNLDNKDESDNRVLMQKLLRPVPRMDMAPILSDFASAAIDISDGLSADLNHICSQSGVAAILDAQAIPVHSLVAKYQQDKALNFALTGGDDYELCFTVPSERLKAMNKAMDFAGLDYYQIGRMEAGSGLHLRDDNGRSVELIPKGYSHF